MTPAKARKVGGDILYFNDHSMLFNHFDIASLYNPIRVELISYNARANKMILFPDAAKNTRPGGYHELERRSIVELITSIVAIIDSGQLGRGTTRELDELLAGFRGILNESGTSITTTTASNTTSRRSRDKLTVGQVLDHVLSLFRPLNDVMRIHRYEHRNDRERMQAGTLATDDDTSAEMTFSFFKYAENLLQNILKQYFGKVPRLEQGRIPAHLKSKLDVDLSGAVLKSVSRRMNAEFRANENIYKIFNKYGELALTSLHPKWMRVEITAAGGDVSHIAVTRKMDGDVFQRVFTEDTVVQMTLSCLKFLARLHDAGFIHLDIKPENIFVKRNKDGSFTFCMADYDTLIEINKLEADILGLGSRINGKIRYEIGIGTRGYMSPLLFDQSISHRHVYLARSMDKIQSIYEFWGKSGKSDPPAPDFGYFKLQGPKTFGARAQKVDMHSLAFTVWELISKCDDINVAMWKELLVGLIQHDEVGFLSARHAHAWLAKKTGITDPQSRRVAIKPSATVKAPRHRT